MTHRLCVSVSVCLCHCVKVCLDLGHKRNLPATVFARVWVSCQKCVCLEGRCECGLTSYLLHATFADAI